MPRLKLSTFNDQRTSCPLVTCCTTQTLAWRNAKNRPTQPLGRATSAQQLPSVRLRFGFGCASVGIISLYLTNINRLFTNTYKPQCQTINPKVFVSFLGRLFTKKTTTTDAIPVKIFRIGPASLWERAGAHWNAHETYSFGAHLILCQCYKSLLVLM